MTVTTARSTVLAVAVAVAAAVSMGGCSAPADFSTIAESVRSGLAPDLPPAPEGQEFEPRVLAGDASDRIALVTYGSSSCPWLPTAATVDDGVLAITVQARPAEVCTADMAPTTSRLSPVEGFDPVAVTEARVTFENLPDDTAEVDVPIERLG